MKPVKNPPESYPSWLDILEYLGALKKENESLRERLKTLESENARLNKENLFLSREA